MRGNRLTLRETSNMKCSLINIGNERILNPMYGDFKLQVFPFDSISEIILPDGFKLWENQVNRILKLIPFQPHAKTHYLTIDSKFFTQDGYLRREGVHIDGNFCADPNFPFKTWGGTSIKNGEINQDFVSPYSIKVPIGDYVSENKGGIICSSSFGGCKVWHGEMSNKVLDSGEYPEFLLNKGSEEDLRENNVYFMSSNTPHESTCIPKGTRRTLIRITLNHEYDNSVFTYSDIRKLINSKIGK